MIRQLSFLSLMLLAFSACGPRAKKLATVERGMSKTEVITLVGSPAKKNIVNSTEIWDYPDSARSVVFRKDTVYTIITTARARVDSIASWIGRTDNRVQKGFKKAGRKVDSAAKKIGDKLR